MAKKPFEKMDVANGPRLSNEMFLQKEEHVESLRVRLEVLVVCLKYSNGSNDISRCLLRVEPGARLLLLKAAAQHRLV